MGGSEHYRGDEPGGLGMNRLHRWYYSIRDNRVVCFMIQPRHPYKAVRHWLWRRKVNRSLRILDALDWHLKRKGMNRRQIRHFWRDFHNKPQYRTQVLNELTQE